MALRYFNPIEPEYVPTYTPLDPQITSLTNQTIQAQETRNLKHKKDELDFVAENTIDSFSNLSEEDRQFALERFNQTKQKLNQTVETQGARNLMPAVDQEVRSLSEDLRFHKRASQLKADAMAILEESPAPVDVRNEILQNDIGVEIDESTGKPIGIKGGYSGTELNVAKNWEAFSSFINKFNTGRKGNVTEGLFSEGLTEQLADGSFVNYATQLESLNFKDAQRQNMGALLSDPKMRQQLSLYAKAKLRNKPEDISINPETGELTKTYYIPKMTKDGQKYLLEGGGTTTDEFHPDIKTEKKPQKFGSKEAWAASEIVKPYSDKASYYKQRWNTLKGASPSSSERASNSTPITDSTSFVPESVDVPKYYQDTWGQISNLKAQYDEAVSDTEEVANDYFGTDTKLQIVDNEAQLQVEDDSYTVNTLRDYFNSQIEATDNEYERTKLQYKRENLTTQMKAAEQNEVKANNLQYQIESIGRGVRNQIRRDGFDNKYVSLLDIKENGNITIDKSKLEKLAEKGEIPFRRSEVAPIIGENPSVGNLGTNSPFQLVDTDVSQIKEGELKRVKVRYRLAGSGGGGAESANSSQITETYVAKEGNNIVEYVLDDPKVSEALDKAKKYQNKYTQDIFDAEKPKEFTGIMFDRGNTEHKGYIQTIEEYKPFDPDSGAKFYSANGQELSTDDFDSVEGMGFKPLGSSMMNGEPALYGFIEGTDENPVEGQKRVYVGGELATSMAKKLYGDKYWEALGIASLETYLPEMVNQRRKVTFTPNMQENIFGKGTKNSFSIAYETTEKEQGEVNDYVLYTGDGTEFIRTKDIVDIYGAMFDLIGSSNQ